MRSGIVWECDFFIFFIYYLFLFREVVTSHGASGRVPSEKNSPVCSIQKGCDMDRNFWYQGAQVHCIAECLRGTVPSRDTLMEMAMELARRAKAETWESDTNRLAVALSDAVISKVLDADEREYLEDFDLTFAGGG